MKCATAILATLIAATAVVATPAPLTAVKVKRHFPRTIVKRDCEPPSNCVAINEATCEYCCAETVAPNSEHCHIHFEDGQAESCLIGGTIDGFAYHCDEEHA